MTNSILFEPCIHVVYSVHAIYLLNQLTVKENKNSPSNFRPISLLNCSVKIITKVLAARLQNKIMETVDEDQSGFVKTRCIADNFMYAMDLVQTCRKKKEKGYDS